MLEAALEAGISLPHGCRNGACGACKATVVSGQIDLGAYQPNTLTEEDRAAGRALLCTAHARSDLTLEIAEITAAGLVPARALPCRVERMERLADDVMALWLKLPSNERLQFLPGQYIDFTFKDGRRRSFSLANTPAEGPEDDALLELHIRRVPGGWFTTQVFETLRPKDILRIHGPHGSFFLRESDKPAILLAGGTGFAPMQSILAHAFKHRSERHLMLYWGSKDRAGLYRADQVAAWQQQQPRFDFIPVLSEPDAGWPGRTGLVHQAILADFADLSGVEVYACGAPPMIDAARRDFIARGLPETAFFADSFNYQQPPSA